MLKIGLMMKKFSEKTWVYVFPLILYVSLSFIFFGLKLWPDFKNQYLGCYGDPKSFIWYINWWHYAVSHGLNLFITNYLWAPFGVNLVQSTSVPLLGLLLYPVTACFGPVVSYNVVAIFASAFSAYTAYLLGRYIVKSVMPALFGGYIFGFSSYELSHAVAGHLNLTVTFLIPLMILLVLFYLDQKIKPTWFVVLLTAGLTCEFLISKELFFTFGLFLGVVLLLAWFIYDIPNKRFYHLIGFILLSYIFATIIVSPLLYYFFAYDLSSYAKDVSQYSTNALNFFIPTSVNWLVGNFFGNHLWKKTSAFFFEINAYLGVFLIAIIILYGVEFWSRKSCKLLIIFISLVAVCLLGSYLEIGWFRISYMPWAIFTTAPLLDLFMPSRFSMYVFLAVAIIVALWLKESRCNIYFKYALALLAIICLLPNPNISGYQWVTKINTPKFIKNGAYKKWIKRGDIVFALPYGLLRGCDDLMFWQMTTNMYFRSGGGATGGIPWKLTKDPMMLAIITSRGETPQVQAKQFNDFLQKIHPSVLFVNKAKSGHYSSLIAKVEFKTAHVDMDGYAVYIPIAS
jgi:hypothetical protein